MTRSTLRICLTLVAVAAVVLLVSPLWAQSSHTTGVFSGAKVNRGTVTHSRDGHHNMLTMSADFEIPDTPDPHWQVVDSHGNVYLLKRLMIKDDKINKTIMVPDYVPNISKVQVWCAWAEVVLGESGFQKPVG